MYMDRLCVELKSASMFHCKTLKKTLNEKKS